MRRPAKKGAGGVRGPGDEIRRHPSPAEKTTCAESTTPTPAATTRFETASSAPAETTLVQPRSSAPAAEGVNTADTLAALSDAHRDVTRAFGLVLATPGVEEALRAAGRLDGARRVLHRHLEIARARGAR